MGACFGQLCRYLGLHECNCHRDGAATVGGASEDVPVGGFIYTFNLLGFSADGVDFSNTFVTQEGFNSSSDLWFDFSVTAVPLPAAG